MRVLVQFFSWLMEWCHSWCLNYWADIVIYGDRDAIGDRLAGAAAWLLGFSQNIFNPLQHEQTRAQRIVRRHPSCWVLNYNYFGHIPSEDDLRTLKQWEERP